MRWDRATAYLDEILIDLGKSVSRPLPEFNNEFEEVKRAMRDEYKKTMELNKEKWQSPVSSSASERRSRRRRADSGASTPG